MYMAEMLYPDKMIDIQAGRVKRPGKRCPYHVIVLVDKKVVESAEHKNWRIAYKMLEIQLAKQVVL